MTRLLLALFGFLAVTAFASRAADPPSLKGTWVRETMAGPTSGHQVIITLTDHRVSARFRSGGRDPGGHEGWITLEFEGEYARTDSGLLVGTITGMNVDLSKIPEGDSPGEPLGKSVAKMIGEPFCFRARVSEGALTVTDLKVPDVKIDDEHSSREMIAGFASGKYVSSPTADVPLPKLKVAKANSQNHNHLIMDILGIVWNTCTPRSLPSVKNDLPSPKYLDHYPEYFQPDPVFPPQVMVPGPVLSSGNSSAVMPVTMAPQPVPTVIPMNATPQSLPTAVRAEMLMNQSEGVIPLGSGPWMPLPPTVNPTVIKMVEVPNHSDETVIREIDLGEAGTMQVIVRMKRDNAKPMLPLPTPVSQLPMLPPVPSTLIPTAGQLLPPGSMRNQPVMPAIADAWKNATRIEGGIMK